MRDDTGRRWPGLVGLLAVLALAVPARGRPSKDRPDPAGTALYMGQLRDLFATWDRNHDGNLDKQELAHGFRGPRARPYDAATAGPARPSPGETGNAKAGPDYALYPDFHFLAQLDRNNDDKISRAEFLAWARDYAVQWKKADALRAKLVAAQQRLASARPGTKTYQSHQSKVAGHQAALAEMNKQTKAFEKAVQQQLKQAHRHAKP